MNSDEFLEEMRRISAKACEEGDLTRDQQKAISLLTIELERIGELSDKISAEPALAFAFLVMITITVQEMFDALGEENFDRWDEGLKIISAMLTDIEEMR